LIDSNALQRCSSRSEFPQNRLFTQLLANASQDEQASKSTCQRQERDHTGFVCTIYSQQWPSSLLITNNKDVLPFNLPWWMICMEKSIKTKETRLPTGPDSREEHLACFLCCVLQ
jgi:hypothetical protein